MKKIIALCLLLLPGLVRAQNSGVAAVSGGGTPTGSSVPGAFSTLTASTVTVTAGLVVTGAQGAAITYGVTAGSVTVNNNLSVVDGKKIFLDGQSGQSFIQESGGLQFDPGTGRSLNFNYNGAEKGRMHTNGFFGIGTASPATKLHMSSGVFTIDGTGAGSNVSGPSTATFLYGNGSGLTNLTIAASTLTTRQSFLTSGSFTYYSTNSLTITPKQIIATCKGGGGAGGGSIAGFASAGNAGTNSSFNSIVANGGAGCSTGATFAASCGGNGTGSGTASFRIIGASGGSGLGAIGSGQGGGKGGGISVGAGPTVGTAGAANTGGGGAGAGSATGSGAGGGEGEEFIYVINNPAGSYTGVVGAGGTAGTSTTVGGVGGSGYCYVEERY